MYRLSARISVEFDKAKFPFGVYEKVDTIHTIFGICDRGDFVDNTLYLFCEMRGELIRKNICRLMSAYYR